MWGNTYYFFKVGVKIYTLMTYCFWRNYVCDSSYFYSDLEAQRDIAILNIPVVKYVRATCGNVVEFHDPFVSNSYY